MEYGKWVSCTEFEWKMREERTSPCMHGDPMWKSCGRGECVMMKRVNGVRWRVEERVKRACVEFGKDEVGGSRMHMREHEWMRKAWMHAWEGLTHGDIATMEYDVGRESYSPIK
jgi:hypothetical protein